MISKKLLRPKAIVESEYQPDKNLRIFIFSLLTYFLNENLHFFSYPELSGFSFIVHFIFYLFSFAEKERIYRNKGFLAVNGQGIFHSKIEKRLSNEPLVPAANLSCQF